MTIANAIDIQLINSTGSGAFVGSVGATLGTATLNSATLVTSALGTPTSGTLSNCTGLPVGTGISGLGTGVATFLATPTSANLLSAITNPTGIGLAVFNNGPTLIAPALGTPISGNLSNCTGIPSGGITGIIGVANGGTGATLAATGGANQVVQQSTVGGNFTVSQLSASNLSNGVTGSGSIVLATSSTLSSPTFVTPALGTPASGVLSNCTGYPVGSLTGILGVSSGGSGANLSATGGANQVVQQSTAGGAFTVSQLSAANLSNGTTGTAGSAIVLAGGSPAFTGTPNIAAATGSTLSLSTTAGLTINGIKPIMTVKTQIFTSSGTYTPSTGMLYCIIECAGGGGGSGGCAATAAATAAESGGGGSGGYSRSVFTAATIGASQTVTIGAGGTAGTAGANAGGAGGTTSVGALITANGSSGGVAGAAVAVNTLSSSGASGAAVGTGNYAIAGGNSGINIVTTLANCFGGFGAGSYFAPASVPIALNNAAIAGLSNTGQGASGAASGVSTAAKAGALGGSGVVIIQEFCNQ